MPCLGFICLPRRIAGAAITTAALAMPMASLFGQNNGASNPAAVQPQTLVSNDKVAQYWFGVAVENVPAVSKQLKGMGVQPEQCIVVMNVFANSPAAKQGLRPDDLLLEINTVP